MFNLITIVDYKLGNLFSIKNFFLNLNYNVEITSNPKKILKSKIIILPGVGAFDEAMKNIKKLKLDKILKNITKDKDKLFIGICLGFQLMFESSEENKKTKGLSIFQGKVINLNKRIKKLPIPHTGWSIVKFNQSNKKKNIKKFINNKSYYFVHSFFILPKNKKEILSSTNYENLSFCSSISKNNVYGFQFHPEKSGINGIKLINQVLKNHEV